MAVASAKTRLPRVAVLGVGGVGGILASSLVSARRSDVTLVARGRGFDALTEKGLRVKIKERLEPLCFNVNEGDFKLISTAEAECGAAKNQDFVLVATKAHQLTSCLDALSGLVGPETLIVPCVNGMPWWLGKEYLDASNSSASGLSACDPSSRLAREINGKQVLGSMGFISGSVRRDYSRWSSGWESSRNRLQLGDPLLGAKCGTAPRDEAHTLAGLFATTADDDQDHPVVPVICEVVENIRGRIWDKLMINCSINAISALTQASCGEIVDDPSASSLLEGVVEEVTAVATAAMVRPGARPFHLTMDAETVLNTYRGQYTLKSSMQQDVEAGRPTEKDPIVRAVVELGEHLKVPTTSLNVLACLLDAQETAARNRAGVGSYYDMSSMSLPEFPKRKV